MKKEKNELKLSAFEKLMLGLTTVALLMIILGTSYLLLMFIPFMLTETNLWFKAILFVSIVAIGFIGITTLADLIQMIKTKEFRV